MNRDFKVLFLTNNENTKELSDWLSGQCGVVIMQDKLTVAELKSVNPDLIVSFNYRYIIKQDVIDCMDGRILNLHMSYLPWNRGSSPNFWSHMDGTPAGVTIHLISAGLDKGDILFQKKVDFDVNKETFVSTYDCLMREMIQLFKDNWQTIKAGTYQPYSQKEEGSYHCMKDLEEVEKICPFSWNDNIGEYLEKYRKALEEK